MNSHDIKINPILSFTRYQQGVALKCPQKRLKRPDLTCPSLYNVGSELNLVFVTFKDGWIATLFQLRRLFFSASPTQRPRPTNSRLRLKSLLISNRHTFIVPPWELLPFSASETCFSLISSSLAKAPTATEKTVTDQGTSLLPQQLTAYCILLEGRHFKIKGSRRTRLHS